MVYTPVLSGASRSNADLVLKYLLLQHEILGSIVVSIPACHVGDRPGFDSFVMLSYFSSMKTNKTNNYLVLKFWN